MPRIIQNISSIDFLPVPVRADFGQISYLPGASLGPRVQTTVQIVAVLSGEARIAIDDRALSVAQGQAALLLPGHTERFQFAEDRPTSHTWCHLRYADARPVAAPLATVPRVLAMTDRMTALMNLGLGAHPVQGPAEDRFVRHCAAALLAGYLAAALAPSLVERTPEPLQRAKRAIETRYDEPLSLAAIAKAASVSPGYLIRLFQRHERTTPIAYLQAWRVQRGIALLRDTGLRVDEIAYRVGFKTPFHFSRLVKQYAGLSPRDLRRKHWQA